MKRAILIHGWPSKDEFYSPVYPTASNSHWFPWLTKQLMINDIHTVSLEMPNSYYPEYEVWKKELERFEVDEDTILVGHSCGAGFIVRWLSENKTNVSKVFLVAPWIGIDPIDPFDSSFFDFTIDSRLASRTQELTIINSDNDMEQVQKAVEKLRSALSDLRYIELESKGHFTLSDLKTEEFPELLEEILA